MLNESGTVHAKAFTNATGGKLLLAFTSQIPKPGIQQSVSDP